MKCTIVAPQQLQASAAALLSPAAWQNPQLEPHMND